MIFFLYFLYFFNQSQKDIKIFSFKVEIKAFYESIKLDENSNEIVN